MASLHLLDLHVCVCVCTDVYVCVVTSFLNRLPHRGTLLEPQVCTLLISEYIRKICSLPKVFNRRYRTKYHFLWLVWFYLHMMAGTKWYSFFFFMFIFYLFFLISHPFYTHQCIHINPNLPIHHTSGILIRHIWTTYNPLS